MMMLHEKLPMLVKNVSLIRSMFSDVMGFHTIDDYALSPALVTF